MFYLTLSWLCSLCCVALDGCVSEFWFSCQFQSHGCISGLIWQQMTLTRVSWGMLRPWSPVRPGSSLNNNICTLTSSHVTGPSARTLRKTQCAYKRLRVFPFGDSSRLFWTSILGRVPLSLSSTPVWYSQCLTESSQGYVHRHENPASSKWSMSVLVSHITSTRHPACAASRAFIILPDRQQYRGEGQNIVCIEAIALSSYPLFLKATFAAFSPSSSSAFIMVTCQWLRQHLTFWQWSLRVMQQMDRRGLPDFVWETSRRDRPLRNEEKPLIPLTQELE